METYETIEYKNYTINIHPDMSPCNPLTEWDGNHEFCCWHTRYDLGNSKRFGNGHGSPEECQKYAKETNSILLPLFMYDHSGIALSLGREYPFNCPWDSGQVGYILIDRQWLKEFYGKSYFTKKIRQRLIESAENNVQLYNDYLSGSVYGYTIECPDGNEGDSCWGFYGYDHKESGLLEAARDTIDWDIKHRQQEHFKQLKTWIKNHVPLQYRKPLCES